MCFQFLYSRCDSFSNTLFSLALPLSNPSQPKINFLSTPSFSSKNLCKITSRFVFLNIVSIFVLDYADFSLGFWNLGIFEKGVGVLIFCENFFKTLIGLSPICWVCICVGPMRHFDHVLRQISSCSCIFHRCCVLLHVRCLTECPSDILVLNWTLVSSLCLGLLLFAHV